MSTISSTDLEAIKTASKGKDVRNAIYNSIKQCGNTVDNLGKPKLANSKVAFDEKYGLTFADQGGYQFYECGQMMSFMMNFTTEHDLSSSITFGQLDETIYPVNSQYIPAFVEGMAQPVFFRFGFDGTISLYRGTLPSNSTVHLTGIYMMRDKSNSNPQ